jgi:hypothetical protein
MKALWGGNSAAVAEYGFPQAPAPALPFSRDICRQNGGALWQINPIARAENARVVAHLRTE